ncbi:MAG TPA: HAMP domain-containing sensor histidine kinase [Candidatus Acidoferrales bacterium]|nr:HAMP domain-containing sensor histidine kinase [Candidatus Acidoferrales bacterium]
MNANGNSARSGLKNPDGARATQEPVWTEDDEESLRVLKLGGVLGIFMLLAYSIYDQHTPGRMARGFDFHWIALAGTCLFFGLVWTNSFKRYWKLWTLCFNLFLMWLFIIISRSTGDPESRFIAIALCPMATASFVSWSTRWQFAMAATSVLTYAAGQYVVPIESPFGVYRWMGLIAAVTFAQYTAIFIDRYRRRLSRQVDDLEEAARFRQSQIATMAHDIRSPVAALSGYVNLLEADDLEPKDRADVLGRIGSTAWNMDVLVSNVLDYYAVQEHDIVPAPVELDPNVVIAEVAEDCALQAGRRRLKLRSDFARLPACRLDPRHLERIVRNLLAYSLGRVAGSEVVLRTALGNQSIVISVSDAGSSLSPAEMNALFDRPVQNNGAAPARGLGLYIARVMVEAAGGQVEARHGAGRGLTLVAELPLDGRQQKARGA